MFTAQQLADHFEISRQTVLWYAKIGVIPRARGRGSARRYGRDAFTALQIYQQEIPRPGNRITAACFAQWRADGYPKRHDSS